MSSPDFAYTTGHLPSSPSPEMLDDQRRLVAAAALGDGAVSGYNLPPILKGDEARSALDRLEHHLIEISGDSSGSDPEPYVSTGIQETLAEFERGSWAEKWAKAPKLHHEDRTFRWFGRREFHKPILDEKGKPVYGRQIGYFSSGLFESPVFYCSDVKLRMLIKATGGHGHEGNTYGGYCRLPDPEIALPVRKGGDVNLVVYRHQQSRSLREDLGMPKIPR